MKRNLLILTITVFAILSLTSCKANKADIATNEEKTTAAPSAIETNDPNDPDFVPANTEASDNKNKKENNATNNANNTQTNNTKNNTPDANATVFKDYMDTQEYKVKKSGTYEFTCNPSDNTAYWDIYVLNEPFDDALRYLTSSHTPTLKVTKKASTYKLKKGQYVYCSCSQNAFTFEGDSNTFSCPITIKFVK